MPAGRPAAPTAGRFRLLRGGSLNGDGRYLRTTVRGGSVPPETVNFDFGFRCVRP